MIRKIFNKKKAKKLIIATSVTTISLIAGLSAYAIINNKTQQVKEISKTNPLYQKGLNLINSQNQKDATALNMGTSFNYIPQIITNLGPIIYNFNTLSLLNWFGNPIWTINLKTALSQFSQGIQAASLGNLFPVGSVWANMVYSPLTSMIYVMTLASTQNASSQYGDQYIVPIDINTGSVQTSSANALGMGTNIQNGYSNQYQLKMMSTISNGNIAMYWVGNAGLTNNVTNGGAYAIFNPLLNRIVKPVSNVFSQGLISNVQSVAGINVYNAYVINIIPFAPDRNLLVLTNPGRINAPTFGLGAITTVVVNNQLELIKDASGNYVDQNYTIVSHIDYPANFSYPTQEILNQNMGYVPIYYTLFSGIIEIPIYNKMFFLTPSSANPLGYSFSSINLPAMNSNPNSTSSYANNGTFFTGSFDSAGQLFFNMATYDFNNNIWVSSPSVYELTYLNGLPNISTYVDLSSSSNSQITDSDDRYIIIPVPNQIGKMMLLNTKTGISVAIDQNANSSTGNILGTLNGTNPFVPQPDFSLNTSAYLTTPSQLTSSNINVASGGVASMIKILPTTSESNNGKEVPIDNIDTSGTVTIEAWLNYLPWFEDQQTGSPVVTPITKVFTGLKTIQYFSDWNNLLPNSMSQSLPSLITTSQLSTINPFNIDLPLNIVSSSYTIISTDDTTGDITLQYNISYSTNLDSSVVLSYTSPEHTYQLLSSTTVANLAFLGGTTINNINQILQLLQLSQNDLLPSQIAANNLNGILFIDKNLTKKYSLNSLEYSMVANNTLGSIDLTVTVPSSVNINLGLGTVQTTFNKTFVGFNKISDYGFAYNFNNMTSSANSTVLSANISDLKNTSLISQYENMLPSQIDVQDVFNNFLTISGFNALKAFNVTFTPNNLTGQLSINISLSKNYAYFANLNILPFQNGNITIQIDGFKASKLSSNVNSQIQFIASNDPNLLEMQKQQASSVTSTMVLNNLLIIGSNLKNDLTTNDISLSSNNVTGELTIIISLNSNVDNNITFPIVFEHTYSGFLTENSNSFIFQALSGSQLSSATKTFLSTATSDQVKANILANQNNYILQIKGYSISSSSISVYINKYTNLIYITYDFASQSNIPNTVNNIFSVIYSI